MSLTAVKMSEEVWLTCLTHALSTETEEITGLLLGDIQVITLCPNAAVYWTNRALCHRKRKDWGRVEEDCRKAIQLDHDSVKGHYILGLALLQKKEYSKSVKELEKDCYVTMDDPWGAIYDSQS